MSSILSLRRSFCFLICDSSTCSGSVRKWRGERLWRRSSRLWWAGGEFVEPFVEFVMARGEFAILMIRRHQAFLQFVRVDSHMPPPSECGQGRTPRGRPTSRASHSEPYYNARDPSSRIQGMNGPSQRLAPENQRILDRVGVVI